MDGQRTWLQKPTAGQIKSRVASASGISSGFLGDYFELVEELDNLHRELLQLFIPGFQLQDDLLVRNQSDPLDPDLGL